MNTAISRHPWFPSRFLTPNNRVTFPLLAGFLSIFLLSGCTLGKQVPKATISFNPETRQIEIASGKDVVLSNVVVSFQGTNASIQIGYYTASYNAEVIKAALQAQKQQIDGIQQGLSAIVSAAISSAK